MAMLNNQRVYIYIVFPRIGQEWLQKVELPMNYQWITTTFGYHPSDLVADLAGFCWTSDMSSVVWCFFFGMILPNNILGSISQDVNP